MNFISLQIHQNTSSCKMLKRKDPYALCVYTSIVLCLHTHTHLLRLPLFSFRSFARVREIVRVDGVGVRRSFDSALSQPQHLCHC